MAVSNNFENIVPLYIKHFSLAAIILTTTSAAGIAIAAIPSVKITGIALAIFGIYMLTNLFIFSYFTKEGELEFMNNEYFQLPLLGKFSSILAILTLVIPTEISERLINS